MTGRIVVVGSLNLDSTLRVEHLPGAGQTVDSMPVMSSPGGKGAYQAVAAARLGGDVALLGAVGDDDAGQALTRAAYEAGVDVSGVRRRAGRSGHATIIVDGDGENVIVVDAGVNAHVDPDHVDEDLTAADVVVTGNEVPDSVVVAATRRAESLGAVVVHNPSPARPLPSAMPAPQIVVMNEHEFEMLGGALPASADSGTDDSSVPAPLRSSEVVVTRGARGVSLWQQGRTSTVPSVVVAAVDSSGCGDAFLGALVERIAAGCTLVEAARIAAMAGALAATREGTQASYPTSAELCRLQTPVTGA